VSNQGTQVWEPRDSKLLCLLKNPSTGKITSRALGFNQASFQYRSPLPFEVFSQEPLDRIISFYFVPYFHDEAS
jgi:hypothetical protein